ncbi:unnamed protein product [Orchesella dallaii]|uniref:PI-PLC X domain-containing protein 1 n=1 Tax=Orchesella dallaii TaxID=48710 RepID=A0ABP1R3E7_9HEXA
MITQDLFQEPEVFITVCSVAGVAKFGKSVKNLDRRLVLNWNNFEDHQPGDMVALFDCDPEDKDRRCNNSNIIELARDSVNVECSRGYQRTTVRLERKNLSTKGETSLGWWIAYLRRSQTSSSWLVLKSNTLRIRPHWMRELRNVIGDIPLTSLMIPGTHDAGAYMEYDHIRCENIYVRYYICQEDSIYDQLVHGIRYLDVRVAHYPSTPEKFWVNHDKYRIRPLITLLEDVKRFVEETKEIIFLDFHGFPIGFTSRLIHDELFQFINKEIGKYLVPKTVPASQLTPNMLWRTNKTIVITYAESSISSLNDYLWPYLVHAWGNKRKIGDLEKYLADILVNFKQTSYFWSAMAEITPKPIDYVSKPRYGLRGFAEHVNIPLTYWFQRKNWYSNCMIVATDFYLGNNLIEMAVEVNRHKKLA